MKVNAYSQRRIMAGLVWGAILMLLIVISNKLAGNNEIVVNVSTVANKMFMYAAPFMLLVGLAIASHLRAELYVRLTCVASLLVAAQFGYMLVGDVKIVLVVVGMLGMMRWLLPVLHGYEASDIVDISDAPSARNRRAS